MDIGVNVHLPAARANKRVPLDRYTKYKFGLRILKWYHRGHLLGPFDEDDEILDDVREAPVFAVDRADGGKRPVSDASQRLDDGGPSVNEHIKEFAPEKATVEYLHLQQILVTITLVWIMYGTTVQIWAKDLEEGYYNMRVRRDQVRLTAFVFCGLWFLPMTLSMGLSSAPFIFTVFMGYVVEAMLYDDQDTNYLVLPDSVLVHFRHHFPEGVIERVSATHSRIPLILYYLDDMFGIQTAKRIWRQFRGAQRVLLSLSLNAQESKDRKPANYQLILGIGIECRLRFVIIWRPKGEDYVDFAYFLLTLPSLEKRKLFSLSGKARHLALHIPPLAAFARGLEVFGLKDRNGKSIGWRHHIHWNQHIRRAIRILIAAITLAMDIPVPFDRVLRPRSFDDADIELYTDAAGVYGGIGGFVAENGSMFFQVSWDGIPLQPYHDIMWKEMVAVWILLRLAVDRCRGLNVGCVCDNQSVVAMLFKYRPPISRPDLFWIVLQVAELCLQHQIWPYFHWIKGTENVTADRLSRFSPQPFEHCTTSNLKSVNSEAADLLRFAAAETSNLVVDLDECVFTDDDDDDDGDDDDANSADIPKPRQN